jgi:hypothetical protein
VENPVEKGPCTPLSAADSKAFSGLHQRCADVTFPEPQIILSSIRVIRTLIVLVAS